MNTIKEKVGVEAWNKMTEEERDAKYKVYRGDCCAPRAEPTPPHHAASPTPPHHAASPTPPQHATSPTPPRACTPQHDSSTAALPYMALSGPPN
eukprot:2129654-Prymnesium_polylepis.1